MKRLWMALSAVPALSSVSTTYSAVPELLVELGFNEGSGVETTIIRLYY